MALIIVLLSMLASARRLAASTSGSSGILFGDQDHKKLVVAILNYALKPDLK
jgi:hypothetical protein